MADKGFFATLFDFSFSSFITTKLIAVLYGLALVAVVLFALVLLFKGGAAVIGAILVLVFGTLYARVAMESIIVFFRIAENTRDTAAALRREPPAPADDAGQP